MSILYCISVLLDKLNVLEAQELANIDIEKRAKTIVEMYEFLIGQDQFLEVCPEYADMAHLKLHEIEISEYGKLIDIHKYGKLLFPECEWCGAQTDEISDEIIEVEI